MVGPAGLACCSRRPEGGLHRHCPDLRGKANTVTPGTAAWREPTVLLESQTALQCSWACARDGGSADTQLIRGAWQGLHLEDGVLAGLRLQNAPPASSLCQASSWLLQGLPPCHELLEEGQGLQAQTAVRAQQERPRQEPQQYDAGCSTRDSVNAHSAGSLST